MGAIAALRINMIESDIESHGQRESRMMEKYLLDCLAIRRSGAGVAETSYYGALEGLLNRIGDTLRPTVRCILTLKNRGAGLPDGGLFTADQLRDEASTPLPNRGVMEVKPHTVPLTTLAASTQVQRYLDRYGLVLITNLWQFGLVLKDGAGQEMLALG